MGEGNGYPLQYSCLENPMDLVTFLMLKTKNSYQVTCKEGVASTAALKATRQWSHAVEVLRQK